MHRMIALYPPPTDPDAFRKYYEEIHVPLADAMPGVLARSYGFDLAAPDGSAAPYFCTYQADFEDEAAWQASLGSPEGQAAGADVANFATGGIVLLHFDVL
jgi:uncharacterized protein (TIGR02118 family)